MSTSDRLVLSVKGEGAKEIHELFMNARQTLFELNLPLDFITIKHLERVIRVALLFFGQEGPESHGFRGLCPRTLYFLALYLANKQILRPHRERIDVNIHLNGISWNMGNISGYTSIIPLTEEGFDRYRYQSSTGLSQFEFLPNELSQMLNDWREGVVSSIINTKLPATRLYLQALCHFEKAPEVIQKRYANTTATWMRLSGKVGTNAYTLKRSSIVMHVASFLGLVEHELAPNYFVHRQGGISLCAEATTEYGQRLLPSVLFDANASSPDGHPIYFREIPHALPAAMAREEKTGFAILTARTFRLASAARTPLPELADGMKEELPPWRDNL